MKLKDITGQRFGRLVAVKFSFVDNWRSAHWLFRCDCGKEKIINKAPVVKGDSKSCGCLFKETVGKGNITHGMRRTRFYSIWININFRCEDVKNKLYGSRGIKCEWSSFDEFYKDMFPTYRENLSIDRLDSDGNYCKENCKWSTPKEQANNRRSNKLFLFNGKVLPLKTITELVGIDYRKVWSRINVFNWPFEKALIK